MNSEITKLVDASWLRGWVLYDGNCALCRRWIARLEPALTRRCFDLAPLQAPWVQECLDLPEQELLASMRVLTPDGRDFAGADALIFLAKHFWWAWPLYAVSLLPFLRPVLRRVYRWFAARRHCHRETCVYAAPTQKTSDSNHGVV